MSKLVYQMPELTVQNPDKESQNKYIAIRRDKKLQSKQTMYKLLDDSYRGGQDYLNGGHLVKYPREYTAVYNKRLERSIYVNFIQPMLDILVGFIYTESPMRNHPESFSYLIKHASKTESMEAFMRSVLTKSAMYTVGVLVDSPIFDKEQIKTKADAETANLRPYAVMYHPDKIRDFSFDENDSLEWVLLDNSYLDKTNPFSEPVKHKVYRLWTKTHYQDFTITEKGTKTIVEPSDEIPHTVGYVPFCFVNWQDVDGDHISDSPFEDIALTSKQVYQVMSLLDEMLHTGTIKTLFYPKKKKDDVPDKIVNDGIYNIPVATYNPEDGGVPFFGGADLQNVAPYKEALNIYILEIFRKIGMDQDRDKSYVQSGRARTKEFQKTEALLSAGAEAGERCEKFIFETAARWQGATITDKEISITYTRTFQNDDIDGQLRRLYELHALGYKDLQKESLNEIIKITLPNADSKTLTQAAITQGRSSWLSPIDSITQKEVVNNG